MATEAILADVGALYKRLFNHRPLIQNEVHYFVKEFETKREDADLKVLQDSMSKADEVNSVFLNEIMCSNPQFKTIQNKALTIQNTCEAILCREESDLHISQEEQMKLDQEIQDFCAHLKEKEQKAFSANDQEIAKLKEEIQDIRGARAKMRSVASSVSSSITIYPPGTPSSSPDENEVVEGEDGQEEKEGRGEKQLQEEKGRGEQPEDTEGHEVEETKLKLQSEQDTKGTEETNSQNSVES